MKVPRLPLPLVFAPLGDRRPAPLWTVFDPEGRLLGFVETRPGLRIFEIGADYILGRVRDELGVESVQVWPMLRSGWTGLAARALVYATSSSTISPSPMASTPPGSG